MKKIALFLGDVLLFYFSLILTLFLRYGLDYGILSNVFLKALSVHIVPFSWVYVLWILVFYSMGSYDLERLPPSRRYYIGNFVLRAMSVNIIAAVALFYFVPSFGIAPRINLFLNAFIAAFFVWCWRLFFLRVLSQISKIRVLFFCSSNDGVRFAEYIKERPSLGYEVNIVFHDKRLDPDTIYDCIQQHRVDLVVVEPTVLQNKELVRAFYEILPFGITIINYPEFYESITGKVPVLLISEAWFLENLVELHKRAFELSKRFLDILFCFLLSIPALILSPFIALLIKLDSPGPVLYFQTRVGKNGKLFRFVKFRSMVDGADIKLGVKGSGDDERHTRIGKILRKTYLDELPQIINVLRNEMSFVGPRPERPEYVEILKQKAPFYEMRFLVRPGITGWAQINMENDASVEDAPQKLQYDLYYIKNRSLLTDLAILIKTVTILARRGGR